MEGFARGRASPDHGGGDPTSHWAQRSPSNFELWTVSGRKSYRQATSRGVGSISGTGVGAEVLYKRKLWGSGMGAFVPNRTLRWCGAPSRSRKKTVTSSYEPPTLIALCSRSVGS